MGDAVGGDLGCLGGGHRAGPRRARSLNPDGVASQDGCCVCTSGTAHAQAPPGGRRSSGRDGRQRSTRQDQRERWQASRTAFTPGIGSTSPRRCTGARTPPRCASMMSASVGPSSRPRSTPRCGSWYASSSSSRGARRPSPCTGWPSTSRSSATSTRAPWGSAYSSTPWIARCSARGRSLSTRCARPKPQSHPRRVRRSALPSRRWTGCQSFRRRSRPRAGRCRAGRNGRGRRKSRLPGVVHGWRAGAQRCT